MTRFLILNSVILLALLPTASSVRAGGAALLRLSEKDNGKQVHLRSGQSMDIVLFENATTGYQWQIVSIDKDILVEAEKPDFEPASGLLGAGGKKTYHFKAASPGKTELRFAYRRPWEANVSPIKTFTVWITVR